LFQSQTGCIFIEKLMERGFPVEKHGKSSSWLLLLEHFRFISMEMEWGAVAC
jgi:hypothetical protein